MANELTTLGIEVPEFTAQRVSKPNKKGVSTTKTRGMLGVLTSGNKTEHGAAAENLALQLWADHKYSQVISEYIRVFPKLRDAIKTRNESLANFAAENPEVVVKMQPIDLANLSKNSSLASIQLAVRYIDADTVKGEQALYLKIGQGIAAAETALKARLAALAAPTTEAA